MRLSSWIFVYKWTNLICTLFLLMLCLTGLPLVFTEEIEHLSGAVEAPEMAEGTPQLLSGSASTLSRPSSFR